MSYLVNIGDEKTLLKSYVRSFLVCFIAQTVISNISYLVSTSNITLPNTIYHNMKVFRIFLLQKTLVYLRSSMVMILYIAVEIETKYSILSLTAIKLYPIVYMEKSLQISIGESKDKNEGREWQRERERSKTSENGDSLVLRTSIWDDLNHYPNVEQLCYILLVMYCFHMQRPSKLFWFGGYWLACWLLRLLILISSWVRIK